MKMHQLFVPVSSDTTLVFKTGAQRSERPVFVNKLAPCRQACPIGIDIAEAFHAASKGDLDGALRIILQDNPLPGVCGRVCYHPCELECNRGSFDQPINIRSFERFVSDHGRADAKEGLPLGSKDRKIAVIGSGPAGLSAAYHLARLGFHITVFEEKSELGGMLRYGIPPYRLPRDILDREIQRVLSLGIETKPSITVGKDLGWKELDTFDAIFVSVGLQSGKTLSEADDSYPDIITGLEFLKAPPDWVKQDSDESILVVGGGNVAIDVARTLLRFRKGSAASIEVVCPETGEQMPALPEEVQEALEEGIHILHGWAPLGIHREGGKLISVDLHRAEVTQDDASGAVSIVRLGEETQSRPADRLIVAIGQDLSSSFLPEGIDVQKGMIAVDPFHRTSLRRIYAGGDATGGKAFVAHAIASGKMGALAIYCELEGLEIQEAFPAHQIGDRESFSFSSVIGPPPQEPVDLKSIVTYDQINTLFFPEAERNNPCKLETATRVRTFDEVILGIDDASIEREIERCFKCGTCIDCENCLDFCPDVSIIKDAREGLYSFDSDYCKGCGVCATACPRHVVEMVRDSE